MSAKKLNNFHELNFLKLRARDATYPSPGIRYGNLSDIYSFIDFPALKHNEPSSEGKNIDSNKIAINILEDMLEHQHALSKKAPAIIDNKKYTILSNEIRPEHKASLLKILNHKEIVLKKIQAFYSNLPQKPGEIKIVAISLYPTYSSDGRLDYITEDLTVINTAFAKMINKIKQRVIYKRIAGYIRLSMINEEFTPYVHVIFFIKDGAINHNVIKDIVDIWASFTPDDFNCLAEISAFDSDFLLAFQYDVIDKQNPQRSDSRFHTTKNKREVEYYLTDVLHPFPDVNTPYRNRGAFSSQFSGVRRGDESKKKYKSSSVIEQEKSDNIRENQKTLGYNKLEDKASCHLDYFLRVVKKVNIIPDMHTIDCSRKRPEKEGTID
ncbi:TPA: hypothetical protein MYU63_004139 [Citrobacter amalonaticus]|uniref:hypothetical protein n=1 Tax=Enterobacteriaceae TaxID=543 RepID=UPI00321F79A6|nr:hypothetical protein [Citrobacter amalonaticus]